MLNKLKTAAKFAILIPCLIGIVAALIVEVFGIGEDGSSDLYDVEAYDKAAKVRPAKVSPKKNQPPDHSIEAGVYCRELVKARLKAPSAAEFPWGVQADKTERGYRLRSYVDAQNALGATVRTEFDCHVARDGDSWRVISLTMN